MHVRELARYTDTEVLAEDVLTCLHEAGIPYLDWLLGGPDIALPLLAARLRNPKSEISIRDATALFDSSEQLIGVYIALPGDELARRRKADAIAYVQNTARAERAQLIARMQASRSLFAPVEPDEFYLSKVGIRPGARGLGHGRILLDHFLASGQAQGLRRFALDVSKSNIGAIRLYESRGLQVVSSSNVPGTGMAYLRMRLKI
jgi:ribosomal protein S18 acetylase RimI-like enzyme